MAYSPAKSSSPKLSPAQRTALTDFLLQQIQHGLDSRHRLMADGGEIDTWHAMYEQAPRPRAPWALPDGADLPSYIVTEKVDALRARLISVVFGHDPVCTVEGWGEPAERVAKVEAFHQWKIEDERLQTWVAKAIHQSLIEGNGILEIDERTALRKTRTEFKAKPQMNEFGGLALNAEGMAEPQTDESGNLVEWDGDDGAPVLNVVKESVELYGNGPKYSIVSLKDFLYLPVHAKDVGEIWGYARRFWMPVEELTQRVEQGIYDADAVEAMGTDAEQETRAEHRRQGITILPDDSPKAPKELWQIHFFLDVDDDAVPEWLVATVSMRHSTLLRLEYDSLTQPRFVSFVPFPRSDSVYGYSFTGHKLVTIADEHTSLRNMKADRQALALNAPILRLATSTWDPHDQPFGVGAVLDVRNIDGEIKQLQISDVPASTIESERSILGAAERVSGMNDAAVSGVTPETKRTATEINAVSSASFVRVEEAARHIQEALEDLYGLRNYIWCRALEQNEDGLIAPESMARGLEMRGIQLPQDGPFKVTAADLHGSFRFKPVGSVDTADKRQNRNDLAEFTKAISVTAQMFPVIGQHLAADPKIGVEIFNQICKLYGFPQVQMSGAQGVAAPAGMLPAGPQQMALPPGLEQGLSGLLGGGEGMPMPPMMPPPGMVQ